MKQIFILGFIAALIPSATFAADQKTESWEFANIMGNIIVAEEICDLTYNKESLVKLIEVGISADNLYFADDLQTNISLAKSDMADMSNTGIIVFCTQMKRVAKKYYLIK